MSAVRRPDPFPGFEGSLTVESDTFFSAVPQGLRLLGAAEPSVLLGDLEPDELLYRCIGSDSDPGTLTLQWVEPGHEEPFLDLDAHVICHYAITDEGIRDLAAPCVCI